MSEQSKVKELYQSRRIFKLKIIFLLIYKVILDKISAGN
jgi:hypothetical protein